VQISLVGPGGFVDIGPAGVTIQGIMVKINSGGAAGSGSGASPEAPADPAKPEDAVHATPTQPTEADDSKTGQKSSPD
jgi:type VI secretion system secreted protein VgrG